MKANLLHIFLLLLCIPLSGFSQIGDQEPEFYRKLGIQDAMHELALTNLNEEDEKDFWLDQKAFEKLLEEKDPIGHQSYLNGKYLVYREHQILCGNSCEHSYEFLKQMAYYLINGNVGSGGTEVVLAPKQ